jgi:hypothetical protein
MTKEDIIRLYKEANGWSPEGFDRTVQELEHFAELVRADERDRAMRENAYVQAEREACANTCIDVAYRISHDGFDCADAIRARGNT